MVSLIKYEFKSTARVFLPIYGVLLAVCFIAGLSSPSSYGSTALYGVQFLVVFALIIAILVLTLVITIQRFAQNLLGDEGYLMFTLPVKVPGLIISKLIAASTWFILSGICVSVGILLLVGGDLYDLWDYILDGFSLINPLFVQNAGLYLIESIASSLVGSMASVLMIYASISVGHLFTKRRGLMAFIAFVGFLIIQSIISLVVSEVAFGGVYYSLYEPGYDSYRHTQILISLGVSAMYGVVYFFVTNYVLSTRLNLE